MTWNEYLDKVIELIPEVRFICHANDIAANTLPPPRHHWHTLNHRVRTALHEQNLPESRTLHRWLLDHYPHLTLNEARIEWLNSLKN